MPSKREISFQFTETNQTKSASFFSMKSDEVMFHIEIRTNESHLSGLTRLTSLVCLGFPVADYIKYPAWLPVIPNNL